MGITIYHNPACETSSNVLALIRQSGVEPIIIDYLTQPPSRTQLVYLIEAAGHNVRDALRQKESLMIPLGSMTRHCSTRFCLM